MISAFGVEDSRISKAFPLGSDAAAAAKVLRDAHDGGEHAVKFSHNCVQCRGAAGKTRAQLAHLTDARPFAKRARTTRKGTL